jgi:hypothetical protein
MSTFCNIDNDLNRTAHPLVIKNYSMEVPNSLFTIIEFRLLSCLWEMGNISIEKLTIVFYV